MLRGQGDLGEAEAIRRLLSLHEGRPQGYAVDIGAFDGVTRSNVIDVLRHGWSGLAIEGSAVAFERLARAYRPLERVALARVWVTPGNAASLLTAFGVPREPELLSLDIDGYDHEVLDAVLGAFRPLVACVEINEKIPPPVWFSVRYHPDYVWAEDHFYGQSITALDDLARRHRYALVELVYNNALLVPEERLRVPALTADEAYREGYLERPDRRRHFPWNEDMEPLLDLDDDARIRFLRERFASYEGRYELRLQARL